MNSKLELFNHEQFGEIQILVEDGKEWFAAIETARTLGYSNSRQAVIDHCLEDGVVIRDVIDSLGRVQQKKFINEGNLYRLIVRSKLPAAAQFERWVFDGILPSIRKHGAYLTPETIEKTLNDPDFIIGLAMKLKEERQARLEAENRLAIAEPKAQKYQEYLDADGTMTFTNIGKHYMDGMSPRKVAQFLQDQGVLRKAKVDGAYVPHASFGKYFKLIPYVQNGVVVNNNLKVRTEGIDFIVELYASRINVMA